MSWFGDKGSAFVEQTKGKAKEAYKVNIAVFMQKPDWDANDESQQAIGSQLTCGEKTPSKNKQLYNDGCMAYRAAVACMISLSISQTWLAGFTRTGGGPIAAVVRSMIHVISDSAVMAHKMRCVKFLIYIKSNTSSSYFF